ncbi:hypothetical protein V5799_011249 [Amblyomma americanum]|uniref:Uncharacterized protein n=1 Tax=Amblyomma americanum TaxID=6943 RepID=A0AAQ4EHW7_AMBAM
MPENKKALTNAHVQTTAKSGPRRSPKRAQIPCARLRTSSLHPSMTTSGNSSRTTHTCTKPHAGRVLHSHLRTRTEMFNRIQEGTSDFPRPTEYAARDDPVTVNITSTSITTSSTATKKNGTKRKKKQTTSRRSLLAISRNK